MGEDAKDDRGRSLRTLTITDLGFYKDKVMVTGLSNQEFSSSFRSIPFPFKDSQDQASLEIYHAAHGKYETNSPIKTFTPAVVGDKEYLIASYTCTPLVLFPMAELKAGKHVKGRTVAELGSWIVAAMPSTSEGALPQSRPTVVFSAFFHCIPVFSA